MILDIEKERAWQKEKSIIKEFEKERERLEYELVI